MQHYTSRLHKSTEYATNGKMAGLTPRGFVSTNQRTKTKTTFRLVASGVISLAAAHLIASKSNFWDILHAVVNSLNHKGFPKNITKGGIFSLIFS